MKKTVIPIIILVLFVFIFVNQTIAADPDWEVIGDNINVNYLWGTSTSSIIGIGNYSSMHYDGTSWTSKSTGSGNGLNAIWGSSESDVFAVGNLGDIFHYDGTNWTQMTTGYFFSFYAVWGRSSSDVYVAGEGGNIIHYDGTSWTSVLSNGIYFSIRGIAGYSTSLNLYACTIGGNILRGVNGTVWSSLDYTGKSDTFYLRALSVSPDGIIYIAGYDLDTDLGILYKGSNTFSKVDSTISGRLEVVWAASENVMYAGGEDGLIIYYDGTDVTEMNSGTTGLISGLWGIGTDVYAADSTDVFHFSAPPEVTLTDPENDASDISIDKIISVTFSTEMDVSTIDSSSFLVKAGSDSITGTVELSGQTATFTPSVDLDYNTTYTVSILNSVKSKDSKAMRNEYSWSFYTDLGTPVADAGTDQTVDESVTVTLDASGSTDPNDFIETYKWEQTGGIDVIISNSTFEEATFIAPDVTPTKTELIFKLTVTDSFGFESTDTVIVDVNWENNVPSADAGTDQTVTEGSSIKLDASSSSDTDGGVSTYKWTQTSGTTVTLSDDSLANPTFIYSVGTISETLSFQLTVTDDKGLQNTDTVNITITDNGITSVTNDYYSFKSSTEKDMGVKVTSGGNITGISTTESSVIGGSGKPENIIYGIVNISIKVSSPGDTATIVVKLPEAAPAGYKWYKYNNYVWKDFSDNAVFNSDRTQITLTLVDGGSGDSDNLANGIIVDPSALGTEPSVDTDTSTDTSTNTSTNTTDTSSSPGPPVADGFTGEETGCFISSTSGAISGKDSSIFFNNFIYTCLLFFLFGSGLLGLRYRKLFFIKGLFLVLVFLFLNVHHSAFAFDEHTKRKRNAFSLNMGLQMYDDKGMPIDYWIPDKNDFNSLELGLSYERKIGKKYGIEIMYGSIKKDKEYTSYIKNNDVSKPEIKNKLVSISAKYDWSVFKLWNVYLGVGPDYYYTKTKYSYDASGASNDYSLKEDFHSFGAHGLIGLEYLINPKPYEHLQYDAPFGLFMEYRYAWVIIKDADKSFIDDYNSSYSTQLSYNDKNTGGHMIIFGLRWHFL